MDLEQTLGQMNEWFSQRFQDKYTAECADEIACEVEESLSDSLRDIDRENCLKIFKREDLLEYFASYAVSHYFVITKMNEEFLGSDEKELTEIGRGFVEELLTSNKKFEEFVNHLVDKDNINFSDIDEEFKRGYDGVEDFSRCYLANAKLVFYEIRRNLTRDDEKNQKNSIPCFDETKIFLDKESQYMDLIVSETLRILETYTPKVFEIVFKDLYK
jgi:hypothetical protein